MDKMHGFLFLKITKTNRYTSPHTTTHLLPALFLDFLAAENATR
jgi:hypothetical protein